jgi:hypothetical protein
MSYQKSSGTLIVTTQLKSIWEQYQENIQVILYRTSHTRNIVHVCM